MNCSFFRVAASVTTAAAARLLVLPCGPPSCAIPSACVALQSSPRTAAGARVTRHFDTSRRSLTSWSQRAQVDGHGHGDRRGCGNGRGKSSRGPEGEARKRNYSTSRLSPAMREKNRTSIYYTISIILGTVALSYAAVPLYKTICQQTGWGGQPISTHLTQSSETETSSRLNPVPTASGKRIRVTFNGSVSDVLPWKFTPQQREVRVHPGETALAFFTATNRSDKDVIGIATYSVTPGQAAPYFSKIQCFCFEEQRLNKGETVDMPVFFFIDPDFVNDPTMSGIETITLSYTFFKAKYNDNGQLSAVPGAP